MDYLVLPGADFEPASVWSPCDDGHGGGGGSCPTFIGPQLPTLPPLRPGWPGLCTCGCRICNAAGGGPAIQIICRCP